ncbi:hypothetical protein LUZ60_013895 [Juncus effusus]|nr:hypothetical protein LUZ60_013895 [Juncus effusus]
MRLSQVSPPLVSSKPPLQTGTIWVQIAPQIILSASLVLGDGGTGTVRQFNFFSEMSFNYVKEKLDYIDNNKYECKASLVEGSGIGIKIESASSEIKFEPKTDSSCVCKVVASYKPMCGAELKEEETEKAKGSFQGVVKKHDKQSTSKNTQKFKVQTTLTRAASAASQLLFSFITYKP